MVAIIVAWIMRYDRNRGRFVPAADHSYALDTRTGNTAMRASGSVIFRSAPISQESGGKSHKFGKPYLVTSINHLNRNVTAPMIDGKRRPIFSHRTL
jgi:hypothetical protein